MSSTPTIRCGALIALAAAFLFGASVPLAKFLLAGIQPWMLAGLLYLGSGIGLSVVALVRGASSDAPLRRPDIPLLAVIIGFGGVAGPVLLMFGLQATTASSASVLLNLEGVFTMLIAWVVFRENVDRSILFGAFAILAGAGLLAWQSDSLIGLNLGSLGIAGACLCWGIDNNLTRKLSASDPVQIAAAKGAVSGAVNIALAFILGERLQVLPEAAGALAVGFFGYGLSLVCFVLALRYLGTARTSAYFGTAPFIGAVLAIVFLDDAATPRFFVAAGLMAIGVWLHLRERHDHPHVHDETFHTHRHTHDDHHHHEHDPGDPSDEPHSHPHKHGRLVHAHAHYPDIHHRHNHSAQSG